MAALKAAGTEQTRKTWARHGFTGEMFGVKFGDLYALRKQIGTDHALAKGLWDSGNVDARLLATMVADPAAFTASDLDRWAASVEGYGLAGEIGKVVSRCPYAVAQSAADRWVGSPREFLSLCGWTAVASMMRENAPIPPSRLRAYLRMIEERQATAPNRAREGMNLALIAIGAYGDEQLAKDALAAAKRIGPILVDHGDTACKDFDPMVEIPKAREHRAKMAAKHTTKAP
jgi:3-methyladenine DNA glycosylase AlkD